MIVARNRAVRETLKNGLQRTIRLRFFGPKKELSDRELTAATVVDFVRTVALVTCVQDGAVEKIIGS